MHLPENMPEFMHDKANTEFPLVLPMGLQVSCAGV